MSSPINVLPHLNTACDLRSLAIGPTEAFVLSRVDGSTSAEQLSLSTGLPPQEIVRILKRLESLNAVVFEDDAQGSAEILKRGAASSVTIRNTPAPESSTSGRRTPRAGRPLDRREEPSSSRPSIGGYSSTGISDDFSRSETSNHPRSAGRGSPRSSSSSTSNSSTRCEEPASPPSYDEALLDEPGDLDRDTRVAILELHAALKHFDHYALLGVDRDAEKKHIKEAYFELVNRFHTDRFFGKDIGLFKAKLDSIFSALTNAHDTLTRKRTRKDYDAYLASREETQSASSSMRPRVQASSAKATSSPTIPKAPNPPNVAPPPEPAHSPRNAPTQAARRAMARRLKGKLRPGSGREPDVSTEPPISIEDRRRAVRDDLRARYDARNSVPDQGPTKYLRLAEEAEAAGEWASAANALKMALDYDPENEAIARRLETAELETDRALASRFLEQAKYEEHDAQYQRAARSYERAARGKQSAELFAKACECVQRDQGDARKAVELARQAVRLAPEEAEYQVILARAYDTAGMTTSALKCLERAVELKPGDARFKGLLKDFKKSKDA